MTIYLRGLSIKNIEHLIENDWCLVISPDIQKQYVNEWRRF